MVFAFLQAPPVTIHARNALSLRAGVYSSIFFYAEPVRSLDNNLPVQYQFTASGKMPPGMKLESYPCNKPHTKVCPQLATANGIYLDGTPEKSGAYTLALTASDGVSTVTREFAVTVTASESGRR
jgi:hypothetical protein